MRQERHAGYEVKALSNLIRRKVWELSGQPECDAFTEMQGMLLGFLCHNRDQEIFQKDLGGVLYPPLYRVQAAEAPGGGGICDAVLRIP